MPQSSANRSALLAPLVVAVSAAAWGLWWIPIRALEARGLSGDWANAALYAAAALLMVPLMRKVGLVKGTRRVTLAVGVLFGGALAAWSHGVLVGDVVRVTLLFYLSPVWGTALGFLFLGERPGVFRIASVILGLGGAATVLGLGDGLPIPRSVVDWAALASGFAFALATTVARAGPDTGDVAQTFSTFVFAALFAPLFLFDSPAGTAALGSDAWAVLPFVLAAAGLWLVPVTWGLLWGAARLDPGRVQILLLLEVVTATFSASLLTDEPFGVRELIGTILILAAGALEALRPRDR
jgi:drug/metabolite transporter (DMT)-like permease